MLISIVYDSGTGHTAKLARSLADGARAVSGAEVKLIEAGGEIPWETLEASDAIVFGSPTYNGLISAKLKQFFEDSTGVAWRELKWRDKIGAGFTIPAQSDDKLNSLISMALFAAQHGTIWVGLDLMPGNSSSAGALADLNRFGSWLGAMAQSNVDQPADLTPPESDLRTAAHLGKRVAEIAARLS